MTRRSKEDVVRTAGRLFAERGYYGTSMRDIGRELGLLGSSLYSHIASKEDLLVEVVYRGATVFQEAAERGLSTPGTAADRLRALIAGHIGVVIDHLDEVRTFLFEARALEARHRQRVVDVRDRYEAAFRQVLQEGAADGSFRSDLDPKLAGIFVLSILNAVERWFRPDGPLDRDCLVAETFHFVMEGIG